MEMYFIYADDNKMTTLPLRNFDVIEHQLNPPDGFNFISYGKQRFGNTTQVKYLNTLSCRNCSRELLNKCLKSMHVASAASA